MSNSNIFHNNNFQQTPINSAYEFSSFSEFISENGFKTAFSPLCIFCSSNNTANLTSEGSFKQCKNCRKEFKARIVDNKNLKYSK